MEKSIKDALKTNNAIIGYRESIKFLKLNKPKMVVIASNAPERVRKEIEYNCKISNAKLETFNGSSKELGIICGKPYPIMVMVIK